MSGTFFGCHSGEGQLASGAGGREGLLLLTLLMAHMSAEPGLRNLGLTQNDTRSPDHQLTYRI